MLNPQAGGKLDAKSFATESAHDRIHDKIHDKVHDKVHNKVHDKVHGKVDDWYQDLGTKFFGETVLGDGGTALSRNPNRYPFFTVRTPQASLVGEIDETSAIYGFSGPWKTLPLTMLDLQMPSLGSRDF